MAIIQAEIAIPDFWKPSHIHDQEALHQHLFTALMFSDIVPTDRASNRQGQ